jgi:hypothetical protein
MCCECSLHRRTVVKYIRVQWKNGITDVQVRKVGAKKYRIIEHCCEHLTPDGTGINRTTSSYESACEMAEIYARCLRES